MAILDIVTVPNPILKQPTLPITRFDSKLKTLIKNMFETATHHEGVGLAGPQVGILEQICVIQFEDTKYALVNPEITQESGSEVMEEGCLSIPETLIPMDRATCVTVRAVNEKGQPIEIKEEGFVARIIQHEIDHLNGILITDNAPFDLNNLPPIEPIL